MELTDYDRKSALWLRLRDHLAERLDAARVRNDDPALDERATATNRGEIRALKRLLALGDELPVIEE